jgi:hypothetical protein
MVGTVGIYSNYEPYTYVIQDGINGVLADNSPDSWFEKLSDLIDDCEKRESCLDHAVGQLQNEFCVERIRAGLFKDIPELLVTRKKKRCRSFFVNKFFYKLFRCADIGYLTLFYLRRSGVAGVVKRAENHMIKGM